MKLGSFAANCSYIAVTGVISSWGSLPHLTLDGLDLTVYSIHTVIMICSL